MRIGFFHAYFPPNSGNVGGIVPYLVTATKALTEAGHDVTMITLGDQPETQHYLVNGVKVLALPTNPTHGWERRSILTGLLANRLRSHAIATAVNALRLDVVEVCDFLNEAVYIAPAVNCPVIVRLHTAVFTAGKRRQTIRNRCRRLIERQIERRYFRSASLLSAPSVEAAAALSGRNPYNVTVDVVPNCVDTAFWQPSKTNARRHDSLLFAGRLEYLKGIDRLPDLLMRLMSTNPLVEMTFAGSSHASDRFPIGAEQWLKDRMPDRASIRMHFLGPVCRERLRELYQSSRLLLVPSRAEAFGLVACEAMACGCVPIVQTNTGLADVVVNNETGLVVDFDHPNDLATQIENLLADDARFHRLSTAGRARAETLFSPAAFANAWIDSAERLFRQKNSRAI